MSNAKTKRGSVMAWRSWRVQPGVGPLLAPAGTLYGPMMGHASPWLDGVQRAVCTPSPRVIEGGAWDSTPHEPPGDRCECGIRGDRKLKALFAYSQAGQMIDTANGRTGAMVRGWHDDRTVIGEVELIGRRLPRRRDDTPSTLRAEEARVGGRVFFARPLWDFADAFERLHPWSRAVRVETLEQVLTTQARTGQGSGRRSAGPTPRTGLNAWQFRGLNRL